MEELKKLSRDEIRKLACKASIKNYKTKTKNELIKELSESTLGELFPFDDELFQTLGETFEVLETFKDWKLEYFRNRTDPFDEVKATIIKKLGKITENVKIQFEAVVEFTKDVETLQHYIVTTMQPLLKGSDLEEFYDDISKDLRARIQEAQLIKSGWSLNQIMSLKIKTAKYKPVKGSSYVELPESIKNKKAIINVKNNDNRCFMYSILAALYPCDKDANRVSKYTKYESTLNFTNISFPVEINSISHFEKLNNISVNVYYSTSPPTIQPLQITKLKREKHVNLFLHNGHYSWIKHLSRLVHDQVTTNCRKLYICDQCLYFTRDEKLYKQHLDDCSKPVAFEFPKDDYIKFKNYHHTRKVPYVIYADFESCLEPIATCEPDPEKSYTMNYQKHEANSFNALTVTNDGRYISKSYRGENATTKFLEYILRHTEELMSIPDKPMNPLTDEQLQEFNASTSCPLCESIYSEKNPKVRDHCHTTSVYRGPLCNQCNLLCRKPKFIPIIFHNLKGYDSHIVMRAVKQLNISIIPQNSEKYLSFSFHRENYQIRFIDSLGFLNSSLDKLSKNLTECSITKQMFPEHYDLLKTKGIYPYDYIDSPSKFDETCLPSKEKFYSKLYDEEISDSAYNHAQEVWEALKIKTLGEYHDIYLKLDTCLLADVFENFRNISMKLYELDPAWYFTSPGLSWDAMLKHTKIKLDLIKDYNKILFLERGIRGGLVQCTKKYSRANNKYMKDYDSSKESIFLLYTDANNLYGWAMSQKLPYSNFEWVERLEDVGESENCFVEVSLEYPKELHDLHNNFPFCPENIQINKTNKLVCTLRDREKYVIHNVALQQAVKHGLKIKEIHRILKFKESNWLQSYIDLNTEQRKMATNDFEKDFYKLMNNAVFGKTMENIRNRVDIRLATESKQSEKLVSKPNFKSHKIIHSDLVSIELLKTKLLFNKPIYVGAAILDISKTLLYDYYYYMKEKYQDNIKLVYGDTDSQILEIKTDDVYLDMKNDEDLYDFSDYPKNHMLYSDKNKKVLGKMKDENCGKIMTEFVGLRSKLYAYKVEDNAEYKKAKGVKKSVVKRCKFQEYYDCLFKDINIYKQQCTIRSVNHQIYTTKQNKLAFNSHDDKVHLLPDGINTLSLFHKKIIPIINGSC